MADPISWACLLFEGYQVYKGLKFGVKVANAMQKDKAQAEAQARAKAFMEKGMDEVDLCNLLSDFLEVNFDQDQDGHLSQREVVQGIKKMQECGARGAKQADAGVFRRLLEPADVCLRSQQRPGEGPAGNRVGDEEVHEADRGVRSKPRAD